MMQEKNTRLGGTGVWLSPDRDIEVMGPRLFAQAFGLVDSLVAQEIGRRQPVYEQARVDACVDQPPEKHALLSAGAAERLGRETDEFKEKDAAMCQYALRLRAFVNDSVGENSPSTVRALASRTAIVDEDIREQEKIYAVQLLRTVLGWYFRGVRESLHRGEKVLGVEDLNYMVSDWQLLSELALKESVDGRQLAAMGVEPGVAQSVQLHPEDLGTQAAEAPRAASA